MATERVRFHNREGVELAGDIDLPPDGAPRAWALFAHVFTGSRNLRASRDIAQALAQEGIAVLRFDFTGLGGSQGEFADTSFLTNLDDLECAADYLAREHRAPQLLVGHSLGGAAVIHAACRIGSVRAVATIGAPADPAHVTHLFAHAEDEIRERGSAEVRLAGRPIRIGERFLDDLDEVPWRDRIRGLRRALLVMHSPVDETVEIANAAEIYTTALHPKSFVSLDDADHLLTRGEDSCYAGALIAQWASRYMDLEQPVLPVTTEELPVAARIGPEGLRVSIRAGGHGLIADEPRDLGGTDTGPTPYGLLLSALGACTAMTLRMYAERKGIPLDDVTVRLAHDRIHAEDCASCETEDGRIDRIRKQIVVEGDLDDEMRADLARIADRCPVHRTLQGEIIEETEVI